MRIKFGGHKYKKDGTDQLHHCDYGCGCYVSPTESGGPVGLDPRGKCPNNIKKGKPLGEKKDYEYVVNQRIHSLESKINRLELQNRRLEARLAGRIESNSYDYK